MGGMANHQTLPDVTLRPAVPLSRIIRPAQAARLLGISPATLYRWERAARLAPRVILGPGVSGWREEDLAAFIDAAPRGRDPK